MKLLGPGSPETPVVAGPSFPLGAVHLAVPGDTVVMGGIELASSGQSTGPDWVFLNLLGLCMAGSI